MSYGCYHKRYNNEVRKIIKNYKFQITKLFDNILLINKQNIHIDEKNIYLNINFKNNINYASCQCDLMVDNYINYTKRRFNSELLNLNCSKIPWNKTNKGYHLVLDLFHNDIEFEYETKSNLKVPFIKPFPYENISDIILSDIFLDYDSSDDY